MLRLRPKTARPVASTSLLQQRQISFTGKEGVDNRGTQGVNVANGRDGCSRRGGNELGAGQGKARGSIGDDWRQDSLPRGICECAAPALSAAGQCGGARS